MMYRLFYSFLLLVLIITSGSIVSAKPLYKYLDQKTAEKAGEILGQSKFFIYFCSNCPPDKSNIRRINISKIEILVSDQEQYSLGISGQIVRGIKPPVFGGYCTEHLTVYSPSMPLELEYENEIDLANTYVWNKDKKAFVNIAKLLGLDISNICIQSLELTK